MEKLLYTLLGGGAGVLFILLHRYFFGKPGGDVHDDGATKGRIDSSLSDVRAGQQQATTLIDGATEQARTVRENLGESGVIVEDIIATLKRDRELIRRGREILEGLHRVDEPPTDGKKD